MYRITLTSLSARRTALCAAPVVLVALAAISAPANAQSRFEPMDVFQLEYAADPQITLVGDRIAYVRTSMDIMTDRKRSELWVVNLDGTGHRRLAAGSSPRWTRTGRGLRTSPTGRSRCGGWTPARLRR